MRQILVLAGFALLCSCGGGGDTSLPAVTGTWDAVSLPVGSALTLALSEQDSKIAGGGTYRFEAGPSGVLTVAGDRDGNRLVLALVYDNGNKGSYAASLQDATHMSGTIAFQDGSTSTMQFVKR